LQPDAGASLKPLGNRIVAMGCSGSKLPQSTTGVKAEVLRSVPCVDDASKTLLQSPPNNKRQIEVGESRRSDKLAAAAAGKKIAKVADSKIYATAVGSVVAVEAASTSIRQEAWAHCDAAWARALEKGKKAEKLWPSLPRLDIVEEPDACEKMEQQVGTENRSVVPQGELEEDDVPEYPINGVPPSSSGRRNCTVMPGVGGIACDVDEDESDQVAAENAEDASKELKLLETVVPFCVGGDAMEQKVECTKAAEEAQKTSAFPVFGFSLFAMCTPHTEEVVEEISVVHSETSALTA